MNKSLFISALSVLLLTISCSRPMPQGIPEGTWEYSLAINGVRAGSAVISNKLEKGRYISVNEMHLDAGYIKNSSVQTVTEGKDFSPIKLEIHNTVEDTRTGKKQNIDKTAVFNDKVVTLDSGGYRAEIKIERPFVLDGNYFIDRLISEKFRKGTKISARIYEPSVEIDKSILVVVEVMGRVKTGVNGREMELIHIKQKVEQLKSMDMYLNEKGVMEKATIKMLNNIFELSRI